MVASFALAWCFCSGCAAAAFWGGFPFSPAGMAGRYEAVRRALRGWKKEFVSRESRRPVSFSLLCSIVDLLPSVCSSPFEASLFSACFSVAFFAALRISELVPPSSRGKGGLLYEDVLIGQDFIRIRVWRSKTDQFGYGAWIPLYSSPGSACPVRLVVSYYNLRVSGNSFFAHANGSPLTKFQFISAF